MDCGPGNVCGLDGVFGDGQRPVGPERGDGAGVLHPESRLPTSACKVPNYPSLALGMGSCSGRADAAKLSLWRYLGFSQNHRAPSRMFETLIWRRSS